MGRVVVLGDVMTDIVVIASAAPATGSDVDARITTRGGGSGANVAAWLAVDGRQVTFIGRVGIDPLGDAAARDLERTGAELRVARDHDSPTGTCVVLVDPDGERTMLPDAGANSRLTASDLPDDAFGPNNHLHISGYALLRKGSRDAALSALSAARAAGMTISVDASSTVPLQAAGPARFLAWVAPADVGLANAAEAAVLTGEIDPESAARALTAHFSIAVVKLGDQGALAADSAGGLWSVPALPVDVVDTTGAGDAFAAGFLGAWTNGAAVVEALGHGSRLASRAVARVGGRP